MADFVETSNTRTAVRQIPAPIADIATFEAIVAGVIADNPFGCVEYVQSGSTHPGVERNRESHTLRVNYEDLEGNVVGTVTVKAPDMAAFNAAATAVLGDAALETALGGDAVRNPDADAFSCQLKCHDASGETYYVTFGRESVRITSYEDEAVLATIEAWADEVAALN
ncbi:hypothetical protein [Methanofollis tationis]|uniref:Uncharacterized protein n=1 Tax=Methanofollis tationis TaxID=81417 RepID=A0A7K4HL31_9EURY|nr:hypothetical protein [Methanofollis tationis]NVO65747.1 hypothetical protein [Methanofollis tationis]